jgi:site-specific recombinase XerD
VTGYEEHGNERESRDIHQAKTKPLFDYVEEYLTYSQSTKARKTHELDNMALERLKEAIGNTPIDAITTQQLDKFKSELSKRYSITSVNMIIRSLRAAFQKAVTWKYIQENPMRSVEYIRTAEEDGSSLTTEDVEKLRTVMPLGCTATSSTL